MTALFEKAEADALAWVDANYVDIPAILARNLRSTEELRRGRDASELVREQARAIVREARGIDLPEDLDARNEEVVAEFRRREPSSFLRLMRIFAFVVGPIVFFSALESLLSNPANMVMFTVAMAVCLLPATVMLERAKEYAEEHEELLVVSELVNTAAALLSRWVPKDDVVALLETYGERQHFSILRSTALFMADGAANSPH